MLSSTIVEKKNSLVLLLVQNIGAWCKCWSKTLVRSKHFVRSNYWSKYLSDPTIDPEYSSGPNIDPNICQVHPGQIHPGLLPSETVELGSNQKKMCETPGCIGKQSLDALTSFWNIRIGSIKESARQGIVYQCNPGSRTFSSGLNQAPLSRKEEGRGGFGQGGPDKDWINIWTWRIFWINIWISLMF